MCLITSKLSGEAGPSLPRFFHDPLHLAPCPRPSFRETWGRVWNCLLSAFHQTAAHFVKGKESLQAVAWSLRPEHEGLGILNYWQHIQSNTGTPNVLKYLRDKIIHFCEPKKNISTCCFFLPRVKSKQRKKYNMLQMSLLLSYTKHMSKQLQTCK